MDYKCARAISVKRIGDKVRKVFADYERKGLSAEDWQSEMQNEITLMRLAKEVVNVPEVLEVGDFYYDMTYCGEPVQGLSLSDFFKIKNMERDLIHKATIYHNDIKPENILEKDGKFYFIDFGRATFGREGKPFFSYLNLVSLGEREAKKIKKLILDLIAQSNAHGGKLPYYELDDVEGVRKWSKRWQRLFELTSFYEKRILDLGCNQGMFCIDLAKQCKPKFVMGVDGCKDIIHAANLTALYKNAKAYFKTLTLANGDKRNPDRDSSATWQDKLGYNWDVVCALSLYHWVQDKEQLLDYLSNFDEVVVEAHSNDEMDEIANYFETKLYVCEIQWSDSNDHYDRPLGLFRCNL